ncbi:MAG TPA: hypothetical protein VM580_21220 [Labilithrix sp.]|nr:hypothetical protein [Labilithrix sp.]
MKKDEEASRLLADAGDVRGMTAAPNGEVFIVTMMKFLRRDAAGTWHEHKLTDLGFALVVGRRAPDVRAGDPGPQRRARVAQDASAGDQGARPRAAIVDGKPVANATVEMIAQPALAGFDRAKDRLTSKTNDAGEFTFRAVPRQEYVLTYKTGEQHLSANIRTTCCSDFTPGETRDLGQVERR